MDQHPKDCQCCKDTPKEVKLAQQEIMSLFGKPGNVLSEKKKVIKELEAINKQLTPAGGISDIVSLAKRFFSVDFDNLKVSQIGPPDPKKKVGKFKVKDLSDNPTIDISKVVNLKGLNLSLLNKLKLSVTVPTITVEKTLKFGPISLGIKFLISLKDISWAPAIQPDFDTPEKALASLKDAKVSKPVSPAEGKSLKDLQKLAKSQIKSPSLKNDLLSAQTSEEFFKKLDANQITLIEEKNIGDDFIQIQQESHLSAMLTADANEKPFDCQKRKPEIIVANFTPEDIESISPCALDDSEEQAQELQANLSELQQELKEIQELANSAPTEKTANDAAAALDSFLGSSNESAKKMDACSKKKQAAKVRYDFFRQVEILHRIPLLYLSTRSSAYSQYINSFKEIIQQRDLLQSRIDGISSKVASIDIQLSKTSSISPNYAALVQEKKTALEESSSFQLEISSLQAKYNYTVEGIVQAADENIDDLTGILDNTAEGAIENLRGGLQSKNNPVSNQVGFAANGTFELFAAPSIMSELVAIKNSVGPLTSILGNYFKPSPFDFSPDTPEEPRTGVLETGVWKKYYDPNRVDLLFTYKEQGYTAPKPVYDSKGKAISAVKKVEFVNGLNNKVSQDVPTSVADCQVDLPVATDFLENIESYTEEKITALINSVLGGDTAKSYLKKVEDAAKIEARLAFSGFVEPLNFAEATANQFDGSTPENFSRSAEAATKIAKLLTEKLASIKKEIADAEECIEKSKKEMVNAAKKYAESVNGKIEGLLESDSIKKEAMAKLGSDPVGATPGNPQFPNYSKNCYWKEYTKILQTVSLMPIPDVEFLNKRLFRYYPVALQFPAGPAPLPTLALGIPDALISVPLPFLWVHVLTISTPFGLFVMWIALAGGIIPNPFIMFIDEKMEPMFLLTPKGPTDLPASQLGVTADEFKSLLDYLKINKQFKIDLGFPTGKLVTGSTRGDATDPDDSKNVIEGIKGKIKKSLDDLVIEDPDFAILNDEGRKKKEKIKKALEQFPPDPKVIDEALKAVMKAAEKKIDELKISDIKIPKSPKKRSIEPPPIGEQLETFMGLIDSAMSAPADVMNIVLKDLGIGVKTLDVKKKLTTVAKTAVEKPKFKELLQKTNEKIDKLEERIKNSKFSADAAEDLEKKIEERAKVVKDFLIKHLEDVAKLITPEVLGFVAIAAAIPPLPEPCFTSVSLPPVPPWVAIALALIKQAPSIIKAIDEKEIAKLLSGVLNLEKPLPDAERVFNNAFDKLLSLVPDLKIPTDLDVSLAKNLKESLKAWLQTFKLRLPKVGLPTQIVIPAKLIKSIIKTAFKAFVAALLGVIMGGLEKAIKAAGPEAVAAIIAAIAIIKMILGVDLDQIKGEDIKAFLKSTIESVAYPALDQVKTIIDTANKLKSDFKSIKEKFAVPDPKKILAEIERGKGPFIEVGTKQIKQIVDPLLTVAVLKISENLPYPVVLLGCATTPTRIALTKINPTKSFEVTPTWEGITTKNIPFIVWLDQLAASAQRYALLGSDYVTPYFTPPSI